MARPIMLDFPESFESERLTIRAPRYGDGKYINEAILESINELRPWFPWVQKVPPLADSEENIRQAIAAFVQRKDLRLMLFLKGTDTFVGSSGLHFIDWEIPKFEIGYWVRTSMQGKGYITEAVHSIAQFAFTHLKAERLEIRCDAKNISSMRVAERANFQLEARFRNYTRDVYGNLSDEMVYAKLAGE